LAIVCTDLLRIATKLSIIEKELATIGLKRYRYLLYALSRCGTLKKEYLKNGMKESVRFVAHQ
jgi:hypothetical protein